MKKSILLGVLLSFLSTTGHTMSNDEGIPSKDTQKNNQQISLVMRGVLTASDSHYSHLNEKFNQLATFQHSPLLPVQESLQSINKQVTNFTLSLNESNAALDAATKIAPIPDASAFQSDKLQWETKDAFETWLRDKLKIENVNYAELEKMICHKKTKKPEEVSVVFDETKVCNRILPSFPGQREYVPVTKALICENSVAISGSVTCHNTMSMTSTSSKESGIFFKDHDVSRKTDTQTCGTSNAYSANKVCGREHKYTTFEEKSGSSGIQGGGSCNHSVHFKGEKKISCPEKHHDCFCGDFATLANQYEKALKRLDFYEKNYGNAVTKVRAFEQVQGTLQKVSQPVAEIQQEMSVALMGAQNNYSLLSREFDKFQGLAMAMGAVITGRTAEKESLLAISEKTETDLLSQIEDLKGKISELEEKNQVFIKERDILKDQRAKEREDLILQSKTLELDAKDQKISMMIDSQSQHKKLLEEKFSEKNDQITSQAQIHAKQDRFTSLLARAVAYIAKTNSEVSPEKKEEFKLKKLKGLEPGVMLDNIEEFLTDYVG